VSPHSYKIDDADGSQGRSIWCAGLSCFSRSSNQTNQKDQIDQMNQIPATRREWSRHVSTVLLNTEPLKKLIEISFGFVE